MMRNVLGISLTGLLAVYGCSAETAGDDVEGLGAAISGSCEGRLDELSDYAQYAALTANEARSAYDANEDNEMAVKYFGQNYDHDLLRQRLIRLVQLGRSSRLTFECLDETDASCSGEHEDAALWTLSTDWQNTDGWNIRVCGDRFWSYSEAGPDSGGDAMSIGTASRIGVMVHEIAHLTGAIMGDSVTLREQLIIDGAQDPNGSYLMPDNAEAFRFYIMNVTSQ